MEIQELINAATAKIETYSQSIVGLNDTFESIKKIGKELEVRKQELQEKQAERLELEKMLATERGRRLQLESTLRHEQENTKAAKSLASDLTHFIEEIKDGMYGEDVLFAAQRVYELNCSPNQEPPRNKSRVFSAEQMKEMLKAEGIQITAEGEEIINWLFATVRKEG